MTERCRILKNRWSATQSRIKKQRIVADLQDKCDGLQKHVDELEEKCRKLEQELRQYRPARQEQELERKSSIPALKRMGSFNLDWPAGSVNSLGIDIELDVSWD